MEMEKYKSQNINLSVSKLKLKDKNIVEWNFYLEMYYFVFVIYDFPF